MMYCCWALLDTHVGIISVWFSHVSSFPWHLRSSCHSHDLMSSSQLMCLFSFRLVASHKHINEEDFEEDWRTWVLQDRGGVHTSATRPTLVGRIPSEVSRAWPHRPCSCSTRLPWGLHLPDLMLASMSTNSSSACQNASQLNTCSRHMQYTHVEDTCSRHMHAVDTCSRHMQ